MAIPGPESSTFIIHLEVVLETTPNRSSSIVFSILHLRPLSTCLPRSAIIKPCLYLSAPQNLMTTPLTRPTSPPPPQLPHSSVNLSIPPPPNHTLPHTRQTTQEESQRSVEEISRVQRRGNSTTGLSRSLRLVGQSPPAKIYIGPHHLLRGKERPSTLSNPTRPPAKRSITRAGVAGLERWVYLGGAAFAGGASKSGKSW